MAHDPSRVARVRLHVRRVVARHLGHFLAAGQAAVAQSAGIHNPANAGAVAKAGQANAAAANLARADMADARFLQKEQEARGGPVVGSRKRTSTQRMNL